MTTRSKADGRAEWVLVANASRARCFERDPQTSHLRELTGFVCEEARTKPSHVGDDRPGQAIKGGASTRFEPRTGEHQKHRTEFARELAAYLDEAALAHRYDRLALIASDPFLGELRAQLGDASRRFVVATRSLDLTQLADRELQDRVTGALAGHSI